MSGSGEMNLLKLRSIYYADKPCIYTSRPTINRYTRRGILMKACIDYRGCDIKDKCNTSN